jgi:hypothetical protein
MEPAQRALHPSASVTDAVFELRTQFGGAVATLRPKNYKPVNDDDDAIFSAVLRAFKAFGRDSEDAFEMIRERIARHDDSMADYGPLAFDWKLGREEASVKEKRDVQRLRGLVASRLGRDFDEYCSDSERNAAELRAAYESLLHWTYRGKLSATEELRLVRQMLALSEMAAMDGTDPRVRDGIGAALAYAARSEHDCVRKCLNALRQLRISPGGARHEERNAMVATTRMMLQKSPLAILDAVADLFAMHVDVYKWDEQVGGIAGAECYYSVGPNPVDWDVDQPRAMLDSFTQDAGLNGYPLIELIYKVDGNQARFLVNQPLEDDVVANSRDRIEASGASGATGADSSRTAPASAFVDPCAGQVGALPGSAWTKWEKMPLGDARTQLAERVDRVDLSLSPDPHPIPLEQWRRDGSGTYERTTLNVVRDWLALRMWTEMFPGIPLQVPTTAPVQVPAPAPDPTEAPTPPPRRQGGGNYGIDPKVPMRLRPFNAAEYSVPMRAYTWTPEQVAWVRERLQMAHDSYIEHVSSRVGYGKIMLMTEVRGGANAKAQQQTQGQAAGNSRMDTKDMLQKLMDTSLPFVTDRVSDQTRRIKLELYDPFLKGGNNKEKRMRTMGFRVAMRLILNTKKFRESPQGGWVAMAKWFLPLDEAASSTAMDTDNDEGDGGAKLSQGYNAYGKAMIEKLGFIGGQKTSKGDRARDYWGGLWMLLEDLTIFKPGEEPYVTREELEAVDEDQLPTWEELGYTPTLRTQAPQ